MPLSTDAAEAIAVLEVLALRLGSDGLQVQLHAPPDRRPMLHVTNPRVMMLSELVTADQDGDGTWWFWWSWAERISPARDLGHAASVIARVLASGRELTERGSATGLGAGPGRANGTG
jgi:hypothetical protein